MELLLIPFFLGGLAGKRGAIWGLFLAMELLSAILMEGQSVCIDDLYP